MRVLRQTKEEWQAFMRALQGEHEVIAPVQRDVVRFETVKDPADIHFTHNAYFPLKKYFFHNREPVLLFVGKTVSTPQPQETKRVFFGIRKCDLNAVHKQDTVYLHDVRDPFYAAARRNATFIGYHCETPPSKACFCGTLELKDHFDLMYYERGDHFLVEVGSERGNELVKKHDKLFTSYHRALTQDERKIHGAERLKKHDLKPLYTNPDWKKGVELCLSCGACTALCPTCYCFELHDEVVIGTDQGERVRSWSSCMLPEFSRVAGDHVFRKEREERFKHRIYHQLDYFKDRYGESLCVGCGRCIDGCPTRIDFVSIINGMQ